MRFIRGFINALSGAFGGTVTAGDGDELRIERIQPWGFYSRPKSGVPVVMYRHGDSLVVIGEGKPPMAPDIVDGEIAVSDGVSTILLKADGVHITTTGSIKLGGDMAKALLTEDYVLEALMHIHPTSFPGAPTGTGTAVNPIITGKTTITKAA